LDEIHSCKEKQTFAKDAGTTPRRIFDRFPLCGEHGTRTRTLAEPSAIKLDTGAAILHEENPEG
jgi:hypothetical protein